MAARYYGETDELLDKYAWSLQNSGDGTRRVGLLKPNDLGLFDMLGNVTEWCNDGYSSNLSGSVTDPTGAAMAAFRVCRGGGWSLAARYCRSADRTGFEPGARSFNRGFRVAAVQPSSK